MELFAYYIVVAFFICTTIKAGIRRFEELRRDKIDVNCRELAMVYFKAFLVIVITWSILFFGWFYKDRVKLWLQVNNWLS